jgi:hypothetical protein
MVCLTVVFASVQTWREADAVCFDVDSTVIQDEGLDQIAEFCGVGDKVKEMLVCHPLYQHKYYITEVICLLMVFTMHIRVYLYNNTKQFKHA